MTKPDPHKFKGSGFYLSIRLFRLHFPEILPGGYGQDFLCLFLGGFDGIILDTSDFQRKRSAYISASATCAVRPQIFPQEISSLRISRLEFQRNSSEIRRYIEIGCDGMYVAPVFFQSISAGKIIHAVRKPPGNPLDFRFPQFPFPR